MSLTMVVLGKRILFQDIVQGWIFSTFIDGEGLNSTSGKGTAVVAAVLFLLYHRLISV